MDAVTLIQENLDVDRLLEHYQFEKVRDEGETIRACCKIHSGDNPTAFVINRQTGLWYCHTGGCGGGDAFTLVQLMEGMDFFESVRYLANFFNVDIGNLRITKPKNRHIDNLNEFIKAVQTKRKKKFSAYTVDEEIRKVTKYRGFQEETLQHFQIGYVKKISLYKKNGETYTLYNRLIFPIIFGGVQVGISLRRIKSTDYPKWSHQPNNIEMKSLLYNYDSVKEKENITVCEGINDVLAFYEIGVPSVAVFGSHISEEQYRLLLKTGADLILAFDGDNAGEKATKQAIKMFKNKANLFVIPFEAGEDPGSISREELKSKYENRRKM